MALPTSRLTFLSSLDSSFRKGVFRKSLFGALASLASLGFSLAMTPSHATAAYGPKTDIPIEELMTSGALPEIELGKASAPNTIIEYSSFTCGNCADFHEKVFPQLKKKYIDTGKVRYIFRELPLDDVAVVASMLVRCAKVSKRYDLIKLLYSHQEIWASKTADHLQELLKLTKQVGLNDELFNLCLHDDATFKHILWVRLRAMSQFNVRAAPSFFINGKFLNSPGAANLAEFSDALDPKN